MGAGRLWFHRRTVSFILWEQRTLDSSHAQHTLSGGDVKVCLSYNNVWRRIWPLSKNGHRTFDVCNVLSACRAHESETGMVSLLVGALRPVSHKGLHQSWTQISLYLQVIHFTSRHTTSHAFFAYLYSAGTQHGNLHPTGWPILFCGPTKEPCVSHSQNRKNRERFANNAGEWTGRVTISKEEIPGSKRNM